MDKLYILDYDDNKYELDEDLYLISCIFVTIVSGDEILTLVFNDGSIKVYDAASFGVSRITSFYDGSYVVETPALNTQWLNRKSATDYCWGN